MEKDFVTEVENALVELGDFETIQKRIVTVRDIPAHYNLLSSAVVKDDVIAYLTSLFFDAYKRKERFQRKKSIIVLKRVVRNRAIRAGLPTKVLERLFFIFQEYIFDRNETTQWAVSTMLKDETLSEEQLAWLIAHSEQSVHALNRLLRHPTVPPAVAQWATLCIEHKLHMDRFSELVGLIIGSESDISVLLENYGGRAIVWGIYYSRLEPIEKQSLLDKIPVDHSSFHDYVIVCERTGFSEALRTRLRQNVGQMSIKVAH